MANLAFAVGGILIIALGFVMLIYALPGMLEGTDTRLGHSQENATDFSKTGINFTHDWVSVFPGIFIMLGFGMSVVGVLK